MPRGPNGEKRPADPIANAVHVMRIATGQIEDELPAATRAGGLKGGKARAEALSPEERRAIASLGGKTRKAKTKATAG